MSECHSPPLLRSVASAPGKLILFGEHAVVHDRPAVAVATSLRTTATLEELLEAHIVLSFPDLCSASIIVPLIALQPCSSFSPQSPSPCPPEMLQLLQSVVADHATQQQKTNAAFIAAVVPALFLLVCVVTVPVSRERSVARGLRLHVHSDLPVGAGLGSSAAFSVSVAAAALELSALSTAASRDLRSAPSRIDRSAVNDWALQARPQPQLRSSAPDVGQGERLLHGNPSGIDNATSTFGGALRFQKSRGFSSTVIPSLPLLLVSFCSATFSSHFCNVLSIMVVQVNTMQPRDTRSLVAAVGRRLQQHPSVFAPLLDALGNQASRLAARWH
jgi:mevalonate kinase